jgi:hypothetical protein
MDANVPPDWRPVEKADFVRYLETCSDFRTDGWWNGTVYYFTHNARRFAIELDDGRILCSPNILVIR